MSSSREVRHRKSRRLKIEWLVLTLVRVRFLLEASLSIGTVFDGVLFAESDGEDMGLWH